MWKSAYNTKPIDLKPGDKLGTVIVAVIGDVGDWAAYEVEIPCPSSAHPEMEGTPVENFAEFVTEQGEKINQEAAEKLFPVCRDLKWRR